MASKAMNPEERLQKNVGLEIQRRLLNEHAKYQADAVAVAKWESTMEQRDMLAHNKRLKAKAQADSITTDLHINSVREQKLIELYKQDEMKYEKELAAQGYAYRK